MNPKRESKWKIQDLGTRPGYPDWHEYAIRDRKTNVHIATVGNVDRYFEKENKAQAALMVQAPELLAQRNELIAIASLLAAMPDHSPEWLENPSVQVDLRKAVFYARQFIAENQTTP